METLLEKTKVGDTMSIGAQKEGDELGLFIGHNEQNSDIYRTGEEDQVLNLDVTFSLLQHG